MSHSSHHGHAQAGSAENLPHVDTNERGAPRDGQPQVMDRRLFMQLLVFTDKSRSEQARVLSSLGEPLAQKGVGTVIYEDVNDPHGFGLLTWSEDPGVFVGPVRETLRRPELSGLELRPEMTMLGRSYSTGYESDLEFWLLRRPQETALEAKWPWAVWYPLRRSGAFMKLDGREQGAIMKEHGLIGRAYGAQDLAHDIRLACHGLDAHDNEFVIGLVGAKLHPLSHVVQAMRKTRQTSEFIVQMGPFFVGRAVVRSPAR